MNGFSGRSINGLELRDMTYWQMNISEANIYVQELLSKGLASRDLLLLAAHYRRLDLEQDLLKRTQSIIVDGIFKGVKHTGCAHGSLLCPKILGTYEKEISAEIIRLSNDKDCFIEIGCAEGYYTTGIGVVTDIPSIIGVDISPPALIEAKKSAEINLIGQKCSFFEDLKVAASAVRGRTFAMIDVDGSEIQVIRDFLGVLSATQCRSTTLLIETDYSAGCSNESDIISELQKYEFTVVKVIQQSSAQRFSLQVDHLTNSFLDKAIYGLEGRPCDQKWLIAEFVS